MNTATNQQPTPLEALQASAQAFYDQHGYLRTSDLLQIISDPSHPAHGLVEWDDSIAAHEHRLNTMRRLIKRISLRIHQHAAPERTIHVPVVTYASTVPSTNSGRTAPAHSGREGAYYPVSAVAADPDKLASARHEIQLKLKALRASLDALEAAVVRQQGGATAGGQRHVKRARRGLLFFERMVNRATGSNHQTPNQ